MTFEEEITCFPDWQFLPDNITLHIFSFLPAKSVLRCSSICKSWHRVAKDELLWKELFYRHWQIDRKILMAQGKSSWLQEYKRLFYHTPAVQSEVLKQHHDQVLHVSFAHNGVMFATCSKDGFIRVWDANYPSSLKYKEDMKKLTWKYTQFSQFNKSDTLLLVSGVHFGSNSTSGEIAVFTVQGEFELQCRVINKPYDVFGTWYNDGYLLSGQLYWTGQLQSCSALWLNKAHQDTESERESVVMRLYRFHNQNASSLRTIMVADCVEDPESNTLSPCNDDVTTQSKKTLCSCYNKSIKFDNSNSDVKRSRVRNVSSKVVPDNSSANLKRKTDKKQNNIESAKLLKEGHKVTTNKKVQSMQVYEDGEFRTKLFEVDDSDELQDRLNGTIEYNQEYRDAESEMLPYSSEDVVDSSDASRLLSPMDIENTLSAGDSVNVNERLNMKQEDELHVVSQDMDNISEKSQEGSACEDVCYSGMYLDGAIYGSPIQSGFFTCQESDCAIHALNPLSPVYRTDDSFNYGIVDNAPVFPDSSATAAESNKSSKYLDKLLIFTMGSLTYTPHQIGIKKIEALEKVHGSETKIRLLPSVEDNLHGLERENYDTIDHIIDMHGHIIGLCLSPDQRYLYVNSRPWPKDYVIENALYPPPIAQEIDIHVIDLAKMKEVGTMHRAHKAYTPNDECFFIFLDVCEEYVASGAEDKHGYIWDRHYGVCLNKFPHSDVVNSVAFNPKDSETLVTVSDDYSVAIWRSKNRENEVKNTKLHESICKSLETSL